MSGLFPEQPVLFYPSLARRLGTDEALLLSIYQQFSRHHSVVDADGCYVFVLRRGEWLALADFWDEERLAAVTGSLVAQEVLEAEFQANGSLRVRLGGNSPSEEPAAEPTQPVRSSVRTPARHLERTPLDPVAAASPRVVRRPMRAASSAEPVDFEPAPLAAATRPPNSLLARGPAPSFGGSTGWRRPKDDLERLFEQQEERNRQLHPMYPDWSPSDTAQQMLQKQNIPQEFADSCIDEFVAYWLERDRKEASWDHLFIRLVKKEWVKAQGRQARATRLGDETTEVSGERYQADSRAQRRERITDAVMDIHNTDW